MPEIPISCLLLSTLNCLGLKFSQEIFSIQGILKNLNKSKSDSKVVFLYKARITRLHL